MPGRIVLYGATGYTGKLTARELLARGARPVLAGRDAARLDALAAQLSRADDGKPLETAVASAAEPAALRELIGAGDVLVSTAGPFLKVGQAALTAAVDAGAVYLDSTGEPPFIRQVFECYGPRAAGTGAVLLTAFGYDYVPGNLAGALALEAAGPAATRVDIGYFMRGDMRGASSAGTRASMLGMLLESGYTFRGGRIVSERAAAEVRSFAIGGKTRDAFSIGASEHFALPRLRPQAAAPGGAGDAGAGAGGAAPGAQLTDVGVYLGWLGSATRFAHYASMLTWPLGLVPGMRQALDAQARRIQRGRGEPDQTRRVTSHVVAVAADAGGRELATVYLTGDDPYSFTAGILAWAACRAAEGGVRPAGALGPVEAFGSGELESGCASAGMHREQPAPA
jgi:short subunit dehydrogenase-like uncharacterized protein